MRLQIKKNQTKNRLKKGLYISLSILAAVVLILGVFLLLNYKNLKLLYSEAVFAKNNFSQAVAAVQNENFSEATTDLQLAHEHFSKASTAMKKMYWMKKVPLLGTQIKAIDNILLAGDNLALAIQPLTGLGSDIYDIAKVQGEETSFAKINKKKKGEILQKLYDSPELINNSKAQLQTAVDLIEAIPKKGLLKQINNAIQPVNDNLPLLKQIVDKAIPAMEVLPSVAGYPNEKTYLFLLENNSELRPTGGFIGTYGILKVQNADIVNFETNNIYNLDSRVENSIFVEKPAPMQQYLNKNSWLMRDCNWSPDYPVTAKKCEEFYHLENGPEQNLDGVIAVTPEFIKDLITLTGPITVEGDEFTSENFIQKLQYMTEIGYRAEGLSDADRKDVIGKMSSILMSRMLDLPKEKWPELWTVFVKNVDEKQILLNLDDEKLQTYVQDLNWDGRIKDSEYTGRDFVMIIDANLAALKTDRVMERNIDYSVSKEGDDYVANLQIKYKNNGVFDDFTTRYRSYTRIFVPQGSELISSSGFLTNDRYLGGDPTTALVTQDEEFNKTVFEGFISIEPKSEEIISLKYKLPTEIKDLINNKKYLLYFEKQAGTMNYGLNFSFDIGQKIKEASSLDLQPIIDDNKVQINTDLNIDRDIQISIK